MAYSCCFSLGGNLYFPKFLQKKFYNIKYWTNENASWSVDFFATAVLVAFYFYFFALKNRLQHFLQFTT